MAPPLFLPAQAIPRPDRRFIVSPIVASSCTGSWAHGELPQLASAKAEQDRGEGRTLLTDLLPELVNDLHLAGVHEAHTTGGTPCTANSAGDLRTPLYSVQNDVVEAVNFLPELRDFCFTQLIFCTGVTHTRYCITRYGTFRSCFRP